MKRILFILLSTLFSQTLFAFDQLPDSVSLISQEVKKKSTFNFETEYFFGSNGLTVDLASTYFRNGFINDEMKDVVSNKLKTSNRFGAGFKYEISYRYHPDSIFGLANSFYQIGHRDIFHLDARFSKDVFDIYFRGNKMFAGKTADLSNFEFKQIFYQQFYFMFGHSYMKGNNQFEYSVGLVFNKGHKLLTIESDEASVFTPESGEYLDLNADIEIHRNDSSKNDKIAFNGLGGSIDLSIKWTDKKNRVLEINAQNLGMISWNNQSSFVTADTAFRFEGVDISELFDFSDSVTNTISLDSSLVEPYLTNRTKKSHTTYLPALLKASYSIPVEKIKTVIETEVGYLLFANCKPYIKQNYQYKINSVHYAGLSVGYGGYSNFNIGLNYELKLNTWKLQLKSDAITGYFLKDATSQGAFVSLSKSF